MENIKKQMAVNEAEANRVGLTPDQVQNAVSGALIGVPAGEVRLEDRTIAVRVRAPDSVRYNPRQLGALPVVEPARIAEDLARRDFTVNAMAVGLTGDDLGELHDAHGGQEDLEGRRVRVLHERSFVDDPTRLLRAVRYEIRLGFRMDPDTERLAREATWALERVSGARVRDELLDLLAEPEAPAGLARLRELGVDRGLDPALDADPELAAAAALGAAETAADRRLAALAALVSRAPDELEPWVEALALGRGDRDRVMAAARQGPSLPRALRADPPPSAVHALLSCEPAETLAVALAHGAPAPPIHRFLAELRDVHLEISGDDLIAEGVPESPLIGRALNEFPWMYSGEPGEVLGVARRWAGLPVVAPASSASTQPR